MCTEHILYSLCIHHKRLPFPFFSLLSFSSYSPPPTIGPPPPPPSLSLSLSPTVTTRSEEEEDSRDADDEKGDSDTPEYRQISIQSALKWKYTKESLLKKFDEELDRVREDTEQKVMNQREVAITLNHPSFYPVISAPSYDKRLFGNIDWRWITGGGLVVFVLFILLIVVRAIWCYYPWAGSKDEKCTLFPTGR